MPRKTHVGDVRPQVRDLASMRPRPDAAENAAADAAADLDAALASMRPRPDAAENQGLRLPDARRRQPASMRPRPDAAENADGGRP